VCVCVRQRNFTIENESGKQEATVTCILIDWCSERAIWIKLVQV